MLKAAVFDDLKGATTLLLWGDGGGMAALLRGFDGLRTGDGNQLVINGPRGSVIITSEQSSTLISDGCNLHWRCSRDIIDLAANLTEPLIGRAGHQFLDVCGLAEQVIISRDEYPADMR